MEFLYEENSSVIRELTEAKVGGDSQGDHSEYMQRNIQPVTGATVYCISFVPLQLKSKGKLIWQNPEPNSLLICMPMVFTFAVETDEFIQLEEKKLQEQIENLSDIAFSVGQENFCLKAEAITMCTAPCGMEKDQHQ